MPRPVILPSALGRTRHWRRLACWVVLSVAGVLLLAHALGLGADVRLWLAVADGSADEGTLFLVRDLRGPRAAAAILVGVGFGLAGAITQAVLRNVLASPDIIGVTAGASLGAVASIVGATMIPAMGPLGPWRLPIAAAAGALLAGLLVLTFSFQGQLSSFRLVLVGLGVNAGLGAGVSWLLLRADLPDLNSALVWLTGSLSLATWTVIAPAGSMILAGGIIATVLCTRWLGVLQLGDEVARSLGVRVQAASLGLLGVSVLIAGAAVAIAGPVGFIAFVAPQAAQRLFGATHPEPGPAAVTGAVLMLAAGWLGKTLFPVALPVGLVTSMAGAPFLAWVLLSMSRKARSGS
ncbi:iron ABC transporter permease [Glutamicibacter sp. MNS18]|uniref:FecCD family ABC transporter permease n=1 Tax=Glutamicibacter sp. MNS18 TaxID=2989817 RepID=UPI002236B574|nr:iron ABC transporter permease [Glutamicibacter sp. MNS18]MCW4465680.1 iron ABC transporter permease [Glutamicibacter sp. MNS18]